MAGTQERPRYASRTEELAASPPILPSPRLDRFTRVHVAVVPAIFLPLIAVFAYLAFANTRTASVFGWLIIGYLIWTLTEYWMHRVVFHFEPEDGLGARFHWMIHGVHHDHPNDPMRLVMPPSASLPLAAVFALAFQLVLSFGGACGVSAGFFAGYLVYDMVHFYVHHARPTTRLGRRLRELHMRHHFQDDTTGFGISAPYWDRVFRTSPASRGQGRTATTPPPEPAPQPPQPSAQH